MGQRTAGLRWLTRVLPKRRRKTKSSKKDSKKPKTNKKQKKMTRSQSQKTPSTSCPPPIPRSLSQKSPSQSCPPPVPLPLPLPVPNHQPNREIEEDKRSNPNPEPLGKAPNREKEEDRRSNPNPNPEPVGRAPNDDPVSPRRAAFTLLDTDGDGKILPSELGVLMRSLGGNPSQAQIKSIISEEKLTSAFDYNRFIEIMDKHNMKPEQFDLRGAFKVLDKEGYGFVSVTSLRHVLTNIGEKLEPSEFDEWIRGINVGSDGKIRYEDFIIKMVAK